MNATSALLPIFRSTLTCLLLALMGLELSAQINVFPHISSFEDEVPCIGGCGTTCPLVGTWLNQGSDDLDWINDRSTTPTGNTGPSNDHTFGNSTGYFLYIESSCNNTGYPNKRADIVSAYFDFSAVADTVWLSFWYHMQGNTMGLLHLDVDTTQGQGNWINDFIPAITDNLNEWQQRLVDLGPLMGLDSVRFRFRGVTGSFAYSDMALDDIDFFVPQENDLQVTAFPGMDDGCRLGLDDSVRVTLYNWGTNTLLPGETVELCYRLNSDSGVTETFVLTDTLFTTSSIDLTFAQPIVISVLGTYDVAAWSKETPIGTSHNIVKRIELEKLPLVDAFPYLADFEIDEQDWRAEGIASSWTWGTPAKTIINGAGSGFRAWTTGGEAGNYNNGEKSWVTGPCFDLSNVCRPFLRMKIAWESESTWDGAVLQYSTNHGNSWVRIGNNGDPNNWFNYSDIAARPGGQAIGWTGTQAEGDGSGGWVMASHAIQNLSGRPDVQFRIAFASDFDVQMEGFAFDDFSVSNGVYLGPDQAICAGNSLVLDADSVSGDTYLWSTGATSRAITVNGAGQYWVEVSNNSFCTTRDTIEISSISPGYSINLGNDTSACSGLTLLAGQEPGFSWQWSDGSYGPSLEVSSSGSYWVDANTPCGVVRSDTQQVTILAPPVLDLGPDTTVCGEYLLVADSGASSYQWSTGASTDSLVVLMDGNYSVTATASNGCSTVDSVDLVVSAFPGTNLGADTTLCTGDTLCLTANADTSFSYQWTTGGQTNSICVLTGGVYSVTVENGDGCEGKDTVVVEEPAAPVASVVFDSSNCPSISFFGNTVGGPGTDWFWDFGDGNTSTLQSPGHTYANTGVFAVSMIVTNACAMDTAEVSLDLNCAVGLGEMAIGEVSVFPNPSRGRFEVWVDGVHSKSLSWQVYDLSGRPISKGDEGSLVQRKGFEVDLTGMALGMYILEVGVGNEVLRKRLVVE